MTSMALGDNAHRRIRKIQNILFDRYEMDIYLSDILVNMMDELGTEETIAEKISTRVKNSWENQKVDRNIQVIEKTNKTESKLET